MSIFRYESAGLTVTGPCSCSGSLCTRGAALTPRHFFAERGVRRGEAWHSGLYGGPQSVFRFCEGSARSLHEPVDFPVSAISFAVRLYSQQPAENFSTTPNHFHPLQMATSVYRPLAFVQTAPLSKSAATHREPAQSKPAPSTSSSRSGRAVHRLARCDRQQQL